MNNKKLRKWLRNIHRDLGYFFVGIVVIYGISGMLLNHEITAYSTESHQFTIKKQLTKDDLTNYIRQHQKQFDLNKVMPNKKGYQLFIDGGVGEYIKESGQLNFETYRRYAFIDFVHRLHYNTIQGWKYMADFLAVSLIFFAISGLLLSKGKKSISGRGKWILLAGIIVPVLIYFLS